MIIDDLLELAGPLAANRVVADVRIGLGYTAVRLHDGGCGLAFSFVGETPRHCCSALKQAGSLAGRPATELLEWSRERDALSAAIGVATLNALLPPAAGGAAEDARELIRVSAGDRVGVVGNIRPLVAVFEAAGAQVQVFERGVIPDGCLPDWAAPEVLPECDVVVITGTSLVNRTLDRLLPLANRAREVAVVGPSTPLAPEVFAAHGVTLLSGVRVIDPDRVLRVVSEGGGTRHFGSAVRKSSVRLRSTEDGSSDGMSPRAGGQACSPERRDDVVRYQPIGRIENGFDEPVAPDVLSATESRIVVDSHLVEGLQGLEPGKQVMVVFYFHRSEGYDLKQHPRGDTNRPRRGVFALCSPRRPNPVGVTVVDLLAIEGNVLRVRGLDAINGTPVLDLKPA